MRFLTDIVAAVRAAVGPGSDVGVRVSGLERSSNEDEPTEIDQISRALDATELIDYRSITEGTSASRSGWMHIIPPMSEAAAYCPNRRETKAAVSVPVRVAGRINQPHEAEAVITSGQADTCAMTRALICDPGRPEKASEERFEYMRHARFDAASF